jgi:LIM domain
MPETRNYLSERPSSSEPGTPAFPPRPLSRRRSEEGVLPAPPATRFPQTRQSDLDGTANRRLCAKCGLPMQDKFVRAMGKKFHLECFRCHVTPVEEAGGADGRCAMILLRPSFFRWRILRRRLSTRYVRGIISGDWIYCVRRVGPHYGGRMSLLWTRSTMSNTLLVRFVILCLGQRIVIMNMRDRYFVTIIIVRGLLFGVTGVDKRY